MTAATGAAAAAAAKQNASLGESGNILMDLRKAAIHSILLRRQFTDDVLPDMVKAQCASPSLRIAARRTAWRTCSTRGLISRYHACAPSIYRLCSR